MERERTIDEVTSELSRAVDARDTAIFDGGSGPRGAAGATSVEAILLGLAESTARVQLAERLGADAAADRRAWVVEALRARLLSQAEIARRAGVSREWVRQIGLVELGGTDN